MSKTLQNYNNNRNERLLSNQVYMLNRHTSSKNRTKLFRT